jgi:hypothetical protein
MVLGDGVLKGPAREDHDQVHSRKKNEKVHPHFFFVFIVLLIKSLINSF